MLKGSELYNQLLWLYSLILYFRNPPSDDHAIQFVAIFFALVGYFVIDLFYIAAIINYSLQCQLITYLVKVTVKRICSSRYAVDQAIKVNQKCVIIPQYIQISYVSNCPSV